MRQRMPNILGNNDDGSSMAFDDSRYENFRMSAGSATPKKENVLTGLVAVLIFAVTQGFCDVGRRIATEKEGI